MLERICFHEHRGVRDASGPARVPDGAGMNRRREIERLEKYHPECRPTWEFKKGMRVKMTKEAIENGLHHPSKVTSGTVTGAFMGWPTVLRDGYKTASKYHPSFWEPL